LKWVEHVVLQGENAYRVSMGKPLGKQVFEGQEEGKLTLRQILGIVRPGGMWNWPRIVSNGRLWY
jgi:hypothetical protein